MKRTAFSTECSLHNYIKGLNTTPVTDASIGMLCCRSGKMQKLSHVNLLYSGLQLDKKHFLLRVIILLKKESIEVGM